MSRKFWGTVMVLAALLTAGSGYLMTNRLAEGELETQAVPLRQVPADEVPPMPAVEAPLVPEGASEVVPPVPAADRPVAAVPPDASEKPSATGRRNILFKLGRPTARKVEIIGDFNEWMRQPMKKAGKVWQISIPLAPGSYEYAFVVDDKRVRDPNNKKTASGGKASILTVKPLAVQK